MKVNILRNFSIINRCNLIKDISHVYNNKTNAENISLNSIPKFECYNALLPFKGAYDTKKYGCKNSYNHFAGCIMGGAIGDAFGAPVEFMKLKRIKKEYGEQGLIELVADKKRGEINFTDDTQLTMFTADGILRSYNITHKEDATPNYKVLFESYQNWYRMCALSQRVNKNWITKLDNLLSTGGSGKTCMSVLSQSNAGSIKVPINNSNGSGGVMRVAPIGLYYFSNPRKAFEIAANTAAITHGHPNAYLSAGVYSAIIANIINGQTIKDAVLNSLDILKTQKQSESLYNKIVSAIDLTQNDKLSAEDAIYLIGKGWNGDEALAIAVYTAIKNQNNYRQAIIEAVNHDGDSDTVGSIVGGIVGCYIGWDNIPKEFKGKIKLEKELLELSNDLFIRPKHIRNYHKKYKL